MARDLQRETLEPGTGHWSRGRVTGARDRALENRPRNYSFPS